MAVDERTRHELFAALERVLGDEQAVALMEHLPASGEEVATKTDVVAVRTEVAALRAEMDRRFGDVDRRFGDMQELLLARMEASEQRILATIRGEMIDAIGRQTRVMAFTIVGAIATNAGLVLAAVRLGS